MRVTIHPHVSGSPLNGRFRPGICKQETAKDLVPRGAFLPGPSRNLFPQRSFSPRIFHSLPPCFAPVSPPLVPVFLKGTSAPPIFFRTFFSTDAPPLARTSFVFRDTRQDARQKGTRTSAFLTGSLTEKPCAANVSFCTTLFFQNAPADAASALRKKIFCLGKRPGHSPFVAAIYSQSPEKTERTADVQRLARSAFFPKKRPFSRAKAKNFPKS